MTVRQTLRSLYHVAAEFIPGQLVDVVRGRDYDRAVQAAADVLSEDDTDTDPLDTHEKLAAAFAGLQLTEAEQDAFTEALAASGAIPPAVVDAAPLAPTAGLSDWSLEQLQQHARKWCDLPTVQPGPIPTPDDHPDHQLAKGES